jgi:hypothetical protein
VRESSIVLRLAAALLLLLLSAPVGAQYIEFSFEAPSDNISGLALVTAGYGYLYALDSTMCALIRMHPTSGTVYDTIPLSPQPSAAPVGLASLDDSLWYAEAGTGLVHKVGVDGVELAVHDLSDSGPESITGIAWGHSEDEAYVIDGPSRTVYTIDGSIGGSPPEVYLVLSDCPEVHGICGPVDYYMLGVACDDPDAPVRLYWSPDDYDTLYFGDFESAVAMAQWDWCRFYFSDPEIGMIHRYCCNMGGTEPESSAGMGGMRLLVEDNPSYGLLRLRLSVPEGGSPGLRLVDVAGRVVDALPAGQFTAGTHMVEFQGLEPGVYYAICGDAAAPVLKAVVLPD